MKTLEKKSKTKKSNSSSADCVSVFSKKKGKYISLNLKPNLTKDELLNVSMGMSNSGGGSGVD